MRTSGFLRSRQLSDGFSASLRPEKSEVKRVSSRVPVSFLVSPACTPGDLLLFSAHVPTIYIYIFYSLVLLQILQGCGSLWSGVGWFRMVRQSLAKHAGFYAPQVAVICPCKGEELGLEENLTALARFDYPHYELFIPVASNSDAAMRIIARVQT